MNLKNVFTVISILAFGVIILLNACNNVSKGKQLQDSTQAIKKDPETKPSQAKEVEVTYESCTVYAGSTTFFFKPTKGEMIEVSVLNKGMDDEEKYRIKMPENLVDDSKDLEGPPGANPKMVGKKFKLIYNKNDEIVEVKPFK